MGGLHEHKTRFRCWVGDARSQPCPPLVDALVLSQTVAEAAGGHGSSRAMDDVGGARGEASTGLPQPLPHASGEGARAGVPQGASDERLETPRTGVNPPGFPLSHVLRFEAAAREEREELAAGLELGFMIPYTSALSAVEAFNGDTARLREWVNTREVRSGCVRLGCLLSEPS